MTHRRFSDFAEMPSSKQVSSRQDEICRALDLEANARGAPILPFHVTQGKFPDCSLPCDLLLGRHVKHVRSNGTLIGRMPASDSDYFRSSRRRSSRPLSGRSSASPNVPRIRRLRIRRRDTQRPAARLPARSSPEKAGVMIWSQRDAFDVPSARSRSANGLTTVSWHQRAALRTPPTA